MPVATTKVVSDLAMPAAAISSSIGGRMIPFGVGRYIVDNYDCSLCPPSPCLLSKSHGPYGTRHGVNYRCQGSLSLGVAFQSRPVACIDGTCRDRLRVCRFELDRHDVLLLAFGITISGMQQSCHSGAHVKRDAAALALHVPNVHPSLSCRLAGVIQC